jgi:hypothetical protein
VGVRLSEGSVSGVIVKVEVALPVPDSGVERALVVAAEVLFVWETGQDIRFTGRFVQVFVQILREMVVFSGPLQRTTCLPLFTSIVEQLVGNVLVVVVVAETNSNVAVSAITSKACAIVSTQN